MNFKIIICTLFCIATFAKDYDVAVLYWSSKIEGQVAMRSGLEEQAKAINSAGIDRINLISYVAGDGTNGVRNQIKQFYEVLKRKKPVDLIIIQPTDNAALTPPLLAANKLKIPVIAYDQYILDGKLASFLTSNNYQAGSLGGEYIAQLYKDDYEIKLIIVEYPKVSSTIERVDGFIDTLKNLKQKFKIIGTYNAVEPVSGLQAAKDILSDFPSKNSIDVIFTVNDGGGLSIVDHLYKNKRTEIKIATIDGDPKSVQNIKNGKLTVIDSAQFCASIGRESMKTGYKVLRGLEVSKKILIPTFPITKETLSKYPGWNGKIPSSFTKPWMTNSKWNNDLKRSIND
ncbi:substrate-binding domain-containing protein [Halobacteriovorax sp. HLS]|uniref:sugar ABC transporter substrate-binding protein n=1 Tax=Halobacteriovorax sp. HLS TaxID=2234000 RepID=UPI000FDA4899|nr:substrate-binding domain-containing protein [Halobacteriovorax sp. HLS]